MISPLHLHFPPSFAHFLYSKVVDDSLSCSGSAASGSTASGSAASGSAASGSSIASVMFFFYFLSFFFSDLAYSGSLAASTSSSVEFTF